MLSLSSPAKNSYQPATSKAAKTTKASSANQATGTPRYPQSEDQRNWNSITNDTAT